MKFDVRYYLVAILFILFDLEIAFLFPGPCVARHRASGFWAMMVFLTILVVGLPTNGRRAPSTGATRRTHPQHTDKSPWVSKAFCRKASSPPRSTR